MLEISNLDVSIGPTPILRDISLSVPAGTMCGLIGRNGAGKTTLLRAIMGALRPSGGQISFKGASLVTAEPHHRAHMGVGFMPEDRRLVPELSAEENILLPAWSTKIEDTDAQQRLARIYKLMPEVQAFRDRGATQLSGGQQKFVAFARALMVGNQLLILDEPSEGIAPVFAHRMVEILRSLRDDGQSVMIAESNDAHIAGLLQQRYVIERGSVVDKTVE